MITILYLILSIVIGVIAIAIDAFPGDTGLQSALLGPTIFLLPVKWLPNSIAYYLVASVVTLILIRLGISSHRFLYSRLYLLLFIISWILIGFLGVIFIGFAAV